MIQISVYQCNSTPLGKELLFKDFESLKKKHLCPPEKAYELVYEGTLPSTIHSLDDIYNEFQLNRPEGFKGHTLSVSDVIDVSGRHDDRSEGPTEGFYFIDKIGFKPFDLWEEVTDDPKYDGEFRTVGELRKLLEDVPDETEVWIPDFNPERPNTFRRCEKAITLY